MLSFLLIFITGCKAEYNLEIYNDKYIENTIISDDSSSWDLNDPTRKATVDNFVANLELDYGYHYTKYESNNLIGLEYNINYTKDNYPDSSLFKRYYKYVRLTAKESVYQLSTSIKLFAFDYYDNLDNVTISIKTNHKVISNNADSVDGYKYTWNITRENYQNKYIQIEYYKKEYVSNYNGSTIIEIIKKVLLFVIPITAALIVLYYFKIRGKRANKI